MATRSFVDDCADALRARVRRARQRAAERAETLRLQAREAARMLAGRFGVRRVWLFGSLAWGSPHESSDVDLMVEGLTPEAWSPALASIEDLIAAPVDLVRIEEAPAALLDRVREEGVLLDERL